MRRVIGQILRQIGFEVTEAGNGREALARLQQIGPTDVTLVDWNMPEMDGLAFVKAVRADATYESMRLMMVTTETELFRVATALEAGANEYVMKPFTEQMLREKLEILGIASAVTQNQDSPLGG
jgi:two-component system chemotaxis response regulator CheY